MKNSKTQTHNANETAPRTVILVGGCGGLSNQYHRIAESSGLSLRHFENKLPKGMTRNLGNVAMVIVVVGMVSHTLRDQVLSLAPKGTPVTYARTASVSTFRASLAPIASERLAA